MFHVEHLLLFNNYKIYYYLILSFSITLLVKSIEEFWAGTRPAPTFMNYRIVHWKWFKTICILRLTIFYNHGAIY